MKACTDGAEAGQLAALATENPNPELLDERPHGRNEPLISRTMWKHIIVQVCCSVHTSSEEQKSIDRWFCERYCMQHAWPGSPVPGVYSNAELNDADCLSYVLCHTSETCRMPADLC